MIDKGIGVGVRFIEPKNDIKRRKQLRLKDYNYKENGYYFITVCTHHEIPYIAKFKKLILETLIYVVKKINGVKLDYYILMPNHLHFILILENSQESLGRIVRKFKALVTKQTSIKKFWQRNYYEHIIRNENALSKIREYIKYNPLQEKIDFSQFYDTKGLDKSSPYNKPNRFSVTEWNTKKS